jgi:hypothetical protein
MTDTSRMMDEVRYDLVELTPSLSDSEFVKSLPVTLDKLICLMDLFEKISGPQTIKGGFEKIILFPDLFSKLLVLRPDLPQFIGPSCQYTETYHSLVQEIYSYWRKRRASIGAVLLRQFWRRYEYSSEDPNAIFRDRYEDKSMKLRKKNNKSEVDSYFKLRGLFKIMI